MVIVTDRHGLVRKKLGGKEEFVKIEHSFDWWHFSKWLRKRSKPLAKAHPVIGHIPLNYYRSRIDPSISPICSYCFYKKETNQHFLFVCPYFQPLRKKLLGSHRISPADIQKVRQASAFRSANLSAPTISYKQVLNYKDTTSAEGAVNNYCSKMSDRYKINPVRLIIC